MHNKVSAISALAAGLVIAAAGGAAAADGFSQSPIVVNQPQQGVAVVNGSLVDGRCIAPWSNGAVLGGVVAPNSHYAACNTAAIDQTQNALYKGGLLF
ncbi:hypothetical protein [Streptomyces sp. HUAS TT7]|uniref:hypothetical protein n=1 Tax=Streptomyces sp. HUAS TT7 TaxID=3447507 RepID=UPI003F6585E7